MENRVWVHDTAWTLLLPGSLSKCRMMDGFPRHKCEKPAIAQLRRVKGWRTYDWAYCEDHLYGGRIVNGRVESEVAADSPAALRGYV